MSQGIERRSLARFLERRSWIIFTFFFSFSNLYGSLDPGLEEKDLQTLSSSSKYPPSFSFPDNPLRKAPTETDQEYKFRLCLDWFLIQMSDHVRRKDPSFKNPEKTQTKINYILDLEEKGNLQKAQKTLEETAHQKQINFAPRLQVMHFLFPRKKFFEEEKEQGRGDLQKAQQTLEETAHQEQISFTPCLEGREQVNLDVSLYDRILHEIWLDLKDYLRPRDLGKVLHLNKGFYSLGKTDLYQKFPLYLKRYFIPFSEISSFLLKDEKMTLEKNKLTLFGFPKRKLNSLMTFLEFNSQIASLTLTKSRLEDKDVKVFLSNTSLRSLKLPYNQITDQGVEILASHPHLMTLNLSRNPISERCLSSFAYNTTLTQLNLSQTLIKRPYEFAEELFASTNLIPILKLGLIPHSFDHPRKYISPLVEELKFLFSKHAASLEKEDVRASQTSKKLSRPSKKSSLIFKRQDFISSLRLS